MGGRDDPTGPVRPHAARYECAIPISIGGGLPPVFVASRCPGHPGSESTIQPPAAWPGPVRGAGRHQSPAVPFVAAVPVQLPSQHHPGRGLFGSKEGARAMRPESRAGQGRADRQRGRGVLSHVAQQALLTQPGVDHGEEEICGSVWAQPLHGDDGWGPGGRPPRHRACDRRDQEDRPAA